MKGVGAIKLDSKTLNQDPCIDQNALNASGVNNIDWYGKFYEFKVKTSATVAKRKPDAFNLLQIFF